MSIQSEPLRWTILAVVNIPIFLGLGNLFFSDWAGFWECIRFWFTPDWISLFNGEYFEDNWSEAKLFLFAALCFGALYGEYRFFFGVPFSSPKTAMTPRPPITHLQASAAIPL